MEVYINISWKSEGERIFYQFVIKKDEDTILNQSAEFIDSRLVFIPGIDHALYQVAFNSLLIEKSNFY